MFQVHIQAQEMALNLKVGALVCGVAGITWPKNIPFPNKLCTESFLFCYIHSQWIFLFLSLLSCYNRVILSIGSCTCSRWSTRTSRDRWAWMVGATPMTFPLSFDFYQLPLVIELWFMWNESRKTLLLEKWQIWFASPLQNTWNPFKSWFYPSSAPLETVRSLSLSWKWENTLEKTFFKALGILFCLHVWDMRDMSRACAKHVSCFRICATHILACLCLIRGIQTWNLIRTFLVSS